MAYNPFGQETDVEDFSGQAATAEERKRRLAALAALATGQSAGNVASGMIGERIAPISQAIENPQAALEQRYGEPVKRVEQLGQAMQGQQPQGPVGPVMPQEVQQQRQEMLPPGQTPQAQQQGMMGPAIPEQIAQERANQLPVGQTPQMQAVSPEQFQQVQNAQNVQLPQAGEGVQVAANTNAIPASATVSKEAVDDIHHQAFTKAYNSTDPKERSAAMGALMSNPNVPDNIKLQAQQTIYEDFRRQRGIEEANKKIQAMGPTDAARYLQERNKDQGSYVKAILLQRLGLSELAKQEQEKISPTFKTESMTLGDKKYQVYRNPTGEIVRAFDSAGKEVGQEERAALSAEMPMSKSAMYTGGSKIYSIPKGDTNEGNEYTARFNTHTGKFENIITTGPNAGKQYTGAPGLEKRVETAEAITANKLESSKGLIDYRLQQNLKFAGPMAYTRAGAGYVGRYNAENNTNLGYNTQGVLVDHNTNEPVVKNKDGSINATQRVEKPAQGAAPAAAANAAPAAAANAAPAAAANAAAGTTGVPDLTKPPPYNPAMSPRENQKAQDNWAAVQKKTRQDFTTGPQGKVVTAMNTAVAHLDTLNEAGTALYGGQIPVANKVVREFANQMGLPEYTNFEGIKHIVGTEVAKAVSGSGQTALADRQAIEKEFDSANSPDQLKGIIKKYQELMGGQLKSQKQTWTGAGLHPDEFDSKLLPRTKKVINETEAPTRSKW